MAELITADNVYTTIAPLNGKYFKLEELYSLLSCRMVQILELPGQPRGVSKKLLAIGPPGAQADHDLIRGQGPIVHRGLMPPQIDLGSHLTKGQLPEVFQVRGLEEIRKRGSKALDEGAKTSQVLNGFRRIFF